MKYFQMRISVVIFFCIQAYAIHGQDVYRISLSNFSLDTAGIHFKVSEIIDARLDKNVMGLIQRGMNNRKDLALFEKPGLKEIDDILLRSGLMTGKTGFVIRINTLYISELIRGMKETAKAELGLDFFIKSNEDLYYHVCSIFVTSEPKGLDVTNKHPANIVNVLRQALIQFANYDYGSNESKAFEYEELNDPNQSFRNIDFRILKTDRYNEGFYASFNEFISNAPSIPIDCEIKLGKNIKVKCKNSSEVFETEESVYGFAKGNSLYVLFHRKFYLLQKDDDGFYFLGPKVMGQAGMRAMSEAWITTGIIGASAVASQHQYSETYRIDLSNGSIKSMSGF